MFTISSKNTCVGAIAPSIPEKNLVTYHLDELALVCQRFWHVCLSQLSTAQTDSVNIPCSLFNCWSHLLCFAA
ncbi:MAG: hypothetical protein HC878_02540 [Leptolyngbyaceae cyanobacterium SL_5_14]|nr:hypothetical protein [Leptolyngbyaceae cyanobacterium SL_5_14]